MRGREEEVVSVITVDGKERRRLLWLALAVIVILGRTNFVSYILSKFGCKSLVMFLTSEHQLAI
jgi:hypothetical protein